MSSTMMRPTLLTIQVVIGYYKKRTEQGREESTSLCVVYKSENIYRKWICGGPVNTVYDCTKNGWLMALHLKHGFQAVCSIHS